jgi:HemX protein
LIKNTSLHIDWALFSMPAMLEYLSFTLLAAYVISSVAFLGFILFKRRSWYLVAHRTCILAFVAHTAFLLVSLIKNGYPFILSDHDAYQMIAWMIVAAFLALVRSERFEASGALFLPTCIIFIVLSFFGNHDYAFISATALSPWVVIHLLLAFLAFAVFLASFITGLAFIIQERQIKAKQLGALVRRLPPLNVLDAIHYKALAVGLILLTASIIAGLLLNKDTQGVFFTWDAKQIWVLMTWLLYVMLLDMRIRVGWKGSRGILLSLLGFCIVIIVFFGLGSI